MGLCHVCAVPVGQAWQAMKQAFAAGPGMGTWTALTGEAHEVHPRDGLGTRDTPIS